MIDDEMLPDSEKVGHIVSNLCTIWRYEEAYNVYVAAKRLNKCPNLEATKRLIYHFLAVDEDVKLAKEIVLDYTGEGEAREDAINALLCCIRGLCRIKDIEGAKKLFAEMIEKGPSPRDNAEFWVIIMSLSEDGLMEEAREMLNLMKKRQIEPHVNCYTSIISGYVKGGMMEEACKILSMAKKTHSKLCSTIFVPLIQGYCNLGEYDKVLELMAKMDDYGVEPNVEVIETLFFEGIEFEISREAFGTYERERLGSTRYSAS